MQSNVESLKTNMTDARGKDFSSSFLFPSSPNYSFPLGRNYMAYICGDNFGRQREVTKERGTKRKEKYSRRINWRSSDSLGIGPQSRAYFVNFPPEFRAFAPFLPPSNRSDANSMAEKRVASH